MNTRSNQNRLGHTVIMVLVWMLAAMAAPGVCHAKTPDGSESPPVFDGPITGSEIKEIVERSTLEELIELVRQGRLPMSDVAKVAQNPISGVLTVAFSNSASFNSGIHNRIGNILTLQVGRPFALSDEWQLKTKSFFPALYQPDISRQSGSTTGLGDISLSLLFTRGNPIESSWGIGPVLVFPTATSDALGARKWRGGLSAVYVATPGRWLLGVLATNLWLLEGGQAGLSTNVFSFQYYINYNFDQGWYLTASPIITADWEAEASDRWLVPIGGGIGKVFLWGRQPINFNVQAFYNIERPGNAPEWSIRAQLVFLFPW